MRLYRFQLHCLFVCLFVCECPVRKFKLWKFNINRFDDVHELQNLHLKYKTKINDFIMGHFFNNYTFDLENTLYFFTSGRYEFVNKGYDVTLEALKRLLG